MMSTKDVHTLVLGAGPAGLAAGYTLARAGLPPTILDREEAPGGLMRSIHHRDFVVDVGRKELYNRLAKVDDFWQGILGDDYRPYPHRGGYLYEGHILEMSPAYRGFRRGMPWGMFLGCMFGLLSSRMNPLAPKPQTVEEYFYRTRGRLLTRVASQGFQEKLSGTKWADIPLPKTTATDSGEGILGTLKAAITRAVTTTEVNTYQGRWRHPARGTGQICDALAAGVTNAGGKFGLGARILNARVEDDRVTEVVAEIGADTVCFRTQFVVSSIPLQALITLMGRKIPDAFASAEAVPTQRRTVLLVYLFLNRPAAFPHAWLQVTCPRTRIGRITNYSGFHSDMVPAGKGCLCCEYYCYGDDPLLAIARPQLVRDTIDYCVASGLIQRQSVDDDLVVKLPGADASQNRHNWMTSMRMGLLDEIRPVSNVYHVGRTDLDIATLAGIEAAEAILSGDRTVFDRHFDPAEIGIRSQSKAFEFKLPGAHPS